MKKKKIEIEHEVSSGNVFADLGLPNAEEKLAKADLSIQINDLIKKKKLTLAQTAKLLEIDKTAIPDLSSAKVFRFSQEQLIKFLNILEWA